MVTREPRTRLVHGAIPLADDHLVLSIIDALPVSAKRTRSVLRSGILNKQDRIYREVTHQDSLEMWYFTARMNAIGFRRTSPIRSGRPATYDAVFSRRPSSRA